MGGGAGAQQATAADLKGGALGGDVEGLSPLPSSLDQEVAGRRAGFLSRQDGASGAGGQAAGLWAEPGRAGRGLAEAGLRLQSEGPAASPGAWEAILSSMIVTFFLVLLSELTSF